MKKVVIVGMVIVSFVCSTAMSSFAQSSATSAEQATVKKGKLETLYGTVVSLDVATRQMVVTEEKSGQTMTFTVSKKAAGAVKAGNYVQIAVRQGSTTAGGVWITKKKPATPAPVAAVTAETQPVVDTATVLPVSDATVQGEQ